MNIVVERGEDKRWRRFHQPIIKLISTLVATHVDLEHTILALPPCWLAEDQTLREQTQQHTLG